MKDKKEKKIIITNDDSEGEDELYCEWFKCPACKDESANINKGYNYCPDCGVKLIWKLE